ncbi:MAG: S8 family serine peptidase [Deltaproteobacteria bacterium]|nr:S8 family serine peptidase [Deltaproteobacteria bacterium]
MHASGSRSRTARTLALLTLLALAASACTEPPDSGSATSAIEIGGGPVIDPTLDPPPSGSFVPGEILVQLTTEPAGKQVELAGITFSVVQQLPTGTWRLAIDDLSVIRDSVLGEGKVDANERLSAEAVTLDAMNAIAGDPDVIAAYPNLLLTLSEFPADPPNDPLYGDQAWNYDAIHLPAAWALTAGTIGARIGILDTESSADQHPDLVGKWVGGGDFVTIPNFTYHHGAHVAGIAGASTNNGIGGAGVCWNCSLSPYRVTPRLTTTSATVADVVAALHAADSDPFYGLYPEVDVVNLSFNAEDRTIKCTTGWVGPLKTEIETAIAHNVTVVVSAGNQSDSGPHFPADCDGVISVAAIRREGTIAQYSNRGGGVTLAAPGGAGIVGNHGTDTMYGAFPASVRCRRHPEDAFGYDPNDPYLGDNGVMSTWVSYTPIQNASDYGTAQDPGDYCARYLSGTSMAAPHVTGTVGLMKSVNGNLTPEQMKDILVRTAQTNTPCPVGTCGAGLLDAAAAVKFAPQYGVPTAAIAPPSFGTVNVGATAVASATLANTGTGVMTTSSMTLSGAGAGKITFALGPSCTAGTTCTQPVAIYGTGNASIPLRCSPTAAGTLTATLTINGDMRNSPVSTTVTCAAQNATPPDVTVTPTSLAFPTTPVGSASPAKPVTIRNDGGQPLAFTTSIGPDFGATCTSGCTCTAATCSGNLSAGQAATLAVTFTPTAAGARAATLTIATPGDPDEPTTAVALTGTATQGSMYIELPQFPITRVGASEVITAYIRNTGNAPMHVSQAVLGDTGGVISFVGPCAGSLTCPLSQDVNPNTYGTVSLRFTPVRTANIVTGLTITSNAANSPRSVSVVGRGVAPAAILYNPGLGFGDAAIGSSAAKAIFVGNTNGNFYTVLDWTLHSSSSTFALSCTGSNCTCANNACSGQTVNGMTGLDLTFAPSLIGPASSVLTLTSNDPDHPVLTYTATGSGIEPLVIEDPYTPPDEK